MPSFKAEVTTAGDGGKYSSNAARFATREEAVGYLVNLAWRWTAVAGTRVVESDDPVCARWDGHNLIWL